MSRQGAIEVSLKLSKHDVLGGWPATRKVSRNVELGSSERGSRAVDYSEF